MILFCWWFLFPKTGSHVPQAGLKLLMQLLTSSLNLWSPCLYSLSSGITEVHHQLHGAEMEPGLCDCWAVTLPADSYHYSWIFFLSNKQTSAVSNKNKNFKQYISFKQFIRMWIHTYSYTAWFIHSQSNFQCFKCGSTWLYKLHRQWVLEHSHHSKEGLLTFARN